VPQYHDSFEQKYCSFPRRMLLMLYNGIVLLGLLLAGVRLNDAKP
jgi:hypothetical protein